MVSSPGKSLIAGGYLVLDPHYSGLAVGLSARIYCRCQTVDKCEKSPSSGKITVISPQFKSASWEYNLLQDGRLTQTNKQGRNGNAYIENVLIAVFKYLDIKSLTKSLSITVYADKEYYSQSGATKSHPTNKFVYFDTTLEDTAKTGLGSSAALITSVTAAVLLCLENSGILDDINNAYTRNIIHNLAQYAHCTAQGKVGSGFDVAAAVYGGIRYRRFPATLLEQWSHNDDSNEQFKIFIDSKWDMEIIPNAFPPCLHVIMGDVSRGSATPGMVRKVLSWRTNGEEEAEEHWKTLGEANTKLADKLESLGNKTGGGAIEAKDETVVASLFAHTRRLLREMGEKSGTEIEPVEQTRVLDATLKVSGVVAAGVPGAGGYDAVFCIISAIEKDRVREAVAQVWSMYNVRELDVEEDTQGMREEQSSIMEAK